MAFRAIGSTWGKWDLHFHTPASFDYKNKSLTNQQIVDGLRAASVEVVAITDHHTMDVARIKELQALGSDKLTVLPGIEFRSELGGKETVHFIGIFPEDANLADLWTKLSGKLEIDQPEDNLDNQTVYDMLVACLREARNRRQVIIVTHNPNLAVVCDADQIIHSQIDKQNNLNKVKYTSGSIENPTMNLLSITVLEGTRPAFVHRDQKYQSDT